MTHQKIQAKIAFLRTTLKTHKTSHDMEGYHCITNPYYAELLKQKKAVTNELLAENDRLRKQNSELLSQADQTETSHTRELIDDYNKITFNFDKMKSEYETQIKQLQEHNDKMKSEYETQIKELQEHNDKMKSEYETQIKHQKSEYVTQINQLQERESKIKPEYEERVNRLQECNDKMKLFYEEHISQLQEEANELRKEAKSANDEASGYQAALGSATNVRWSDDTFNNPIQLTKDIEKFQYLLADFTKVKGKSIKIDENAAKNLLTKYEFFLKILRLLLMDILNRI
uniref:Uncharacterized protein n=1 Tax=Rhizophagus irregularis (strain DAOM 181602 / DAOM 197198 / MUCL 43194) TaxID=747089 RepID=U9TEG2_RHIID